ncbi:MAG: hypothetical protein FWG10_09920 [Eubacteriaceae bacterium]|nr:hypothetical protein [Eubacteriaceae bacterium]
MGQRKEKTVKVTGDYVGKVTPEGIVPLKTKQLLDKPFYSLELGASAFIMSEAAGLLASLKKHFTEADTEAIWAISMLRLVFECPFSDIEDKYLSSIMSKMLPGLELSKKSIKSLIDKVGADRGACAAFMRDEMGPAPSYIVDDNRAGCGSGWVFRALPGHSTNGKLLPQPDSVMSYGQRWYFEKFKGGEWRKLKTADNYFTLEGYLLNGYDRSFFPIDTFFSWNPFRGGLCRITAYHPLRVAPDAGNLV